MSRTPTVGRADAEHALAVEQRRPRGESEPQAAPADTALVLNSGRRVTGALLTGLVAGAGMYAVLAAIAVAGGRSALYPFHAVQAMMSGRRVLPDYPIPSVRGPQSFDHFFGPLYFILPALLVAVLTARWASRRRSEDEVPDRRAVLPVALATTAGAFVVLVLGLAFWEASGIQQRTSSGYGVRQLGLVAWVVAHLVYAALLTALLPTITRWVATPRRRAPRALRGEHAAGGQG